ncbi:carboxypeptidase-like regulatory domain-containing protein [Carboxylicivirga mesophila]|uniref:Carboxypeptidase-like regulatory domain-containing protein n=1 Tax=Carboxylicivirga mesophila TaxID=1166478 RepID=A0ABS5K665_9BACT|nr:carboxypeptidase-like regulatory domain-containing protein [Carboxylicivirga mesophila]
MNKRKIHTTTDADAFQRYMNNEMQPGEAHEFERRLLNDPFENEALEGLSSIGAEAAGQDISSLQSKITKRKFIWQQPAFYAAASIAITIGLLSVLWLLQPEQLPRVSDHMELPKAPVAAKAESVELLKPEAEVEITSSEQAAEPIAMIEVQDDAEESLPDEEVSVAAAAKAAKPAEPLKSHSEFQLADAEDIKIEVPKRKSQAGRIEKEVMSVDYGTLEGNSLQGLSDSGSSGDMLIVRGRIIDRSQQPVPGASVNIKGTSLATVAKTDGSYEMAIPAEDTSKSIRVDFIGFVPQESDLLVNDSLNFVLEEQNYALSEVVTLSYGADKKRQIDEKIDARPEKGLDEYIIELEKNLRYPANGTGKKEQVVALITINQRGDIKNIEIKRSPGESYSIETIRVIRNASKWLPATDKGFPVEDTVKIKLQFQPK